jgi:transcriptional regulator with XRE-family HTH domain
MLDLSQEQLAKASGVAVSTIIPFEARQRKPYQSTIEKLRLALEVAGVEFIPENGGGAGVRLRKKN